MNIPPEVFYGVAMIIILACLVWAVMRNRQRTPREKQITEEATRAEYKNPDTYEQKEQELKRELPRD